MCGLGKSNFWLQKNVCFDRLTILNRILVKNHLSRRFWEKTKVANSSLNNSFNIKAETLFGLAVSLFIYFCLQLVEKFNNKCKISLKFNF